MQGHIGCVEARALLEPGPSFCWGPALEGPTSPSSSLFDAGQVDEIHARCAARAPCPPPARASATPPAPRTDSAALHCPHFACTPHNRLTIVHSCAGARFCPFTSITSTRVEGGASRRRGSGAAAAAWPSRTVRALGCPGGGEGGGCCGASPRQQAWAKAGGLTFFGVVTCFFCVRHFIAVLRSCSERTIRDVLKKKTEEGKTQRQPARGDIGHAGSGRLGATRGGSDPPVVILISLIYFRENMREQIKRPHSLF